MKTNSVILLCCSKSDAKQLRAAAHKDRRTISGYTLGIVLRAIQLEKDIFYGRSRPPKLKLLENGSANYPRTTVLLRCSKNEAAQVRMAAKLRGTTMSKYIVHALRRSWRAAKFIGR